MAYVHGISVPFSSTQAHAIGFLMVPKKYLSIVYMMHSTKDCVLCRQYQRNDPFFIIIIFFGL